MLLNVGSLVLSASRFKIVPCVRARPNTKAKVENPMRIIDEIMNYNGTVNDLRELHKKMNMITNEAKLPLPNDKICSFYKNVTIQAKVNTSSLLKYKTKHVFCST